MFSQFPFRSFLRTHIPCVNRIQSRTLTVFAPVCALFFLTICQPAWAGLFDDEAARRAVIDLRTKYEADFKEMTSRLETSQRAQLDFANRIEALQQENAKLRGALEVLSYQVGNDQKQQKDFYTDLDTRLRKLEGGGKPESAKSALDNAGGNSVANAGLNTAANLGVNSSVSAAELAAEQKSYEEALALFKKSDYAGAAQALTNFLHQYPQSESAPAAQYWLGNSYYALGDYKHAISAQRTVVKSYPQAAQVPDAILNIANSQIELGAKADAKKNLEILIAKYPQASAAKVAKERLQLVR